MKTILLLTATALSIQCASAITSAEQLEAWKTEITREDTAIGSKFNLKPARSLQQKAFVDGGVVWAQRYSDAWGGWIYMDWSSARNLHSRLVRGLKASLMANRPSQPVSETTMLAHRKSMQDFRWRNGKIRRLLHTRIQLNVHRGLEADKAHQAHLAYVAATVANNKVAAKAMKIKEKFHNARADMWASYGAQTSRMIRQLGDKKTIDPDKFTKNYKAMLKLAKSGTLPEKEKGEE